MIAMLVQGGSDAYGGGSDLDSICPEILNDLHQNTSGGPYTNGLPSSVR